MAKTGKTVVCGACNGKGTVPLFRGYIQKQKACTACNGEKQFYFRFDNEIDLETITYDAKQYFDYFVDQNSKRLHGRKGCIFVVYDIPTGRFAYLQLGYIPAEKVAEKMFFATEKMYRVLEGNLITSFDTEDIDLKHFGGAIRLGRYILSTSGFPPHMDQEFDLYIAKSAELTDDDVCSTIRKITQKKCDYWENFYKLTIIS